MARMLITTITRGGGGSFLILQDVMGWATGFFIPCLGEGQQKTVSTETDFAGPTPLYFMTSPLLINFKFIGLCRYVPMYRVLFYHWSWS